MKREKPTARRVGKWEWEPAIRESDLRPYTRLVLLVIDTYMGKQGDHSFPSHRTLSLETGLSVSTVGRALREAKDKGFIEWTRPRFGSSNHYVACVPSSVVAADGLHRAGEDAVSGGPVIPVTAAESSRSPLTDDQTIEQINENPPTIRAGWLDGLDSDESVEECLSMYAWRLLNGSLEQMQLSVMDLEAAVRRQCERNLMASASGLTLAEVRVQLGRPRTMKDPNRYLLAVTRRIRQLAEDRGHGEAIFG